MTLPVVCDKGVYAGESRTKFDQKLDVYQKHEKTVMSFDKDLGVL